MSLVIGNFYFKYRPLYSNRLLGTKCKIAMTITENLLGGGRGSSSYIPFTQKVVNNYL